MTWTAHRAAFMPQEALAGIPRQSPDISWIFRARNTAGARLSAHRAAVMKQRSDLFLPDRGRGHFRIRCSVPL
jgi:hypothetical protein